MLYKSSFSFWHRKCPKLVLPDPIPPVRSIDELIERLVKHRSIIDGTPTNSIGCFGKPESKDEKRVNGDIGRGISDWISTVIFDMPFSQRDSVLLSLDGCNRMMPPAKDSVSPVDGGRIIRSVIGPWKRPLFPPYRSPTRAAVVLLKSSTSPPNRRPSDLDESARKGYSLIEVIWDFRRGGDTGLILTMQPTMPSKPRTIHSLVDSAACLSSGASSQILSRATTADAAEPASDDS